jgi:hypothetical protein
MNEQEKLFQLGSRVWEYRKTNGFTKKLSAEIQKEASELCSSGITAYSIGKAIGVPRNTVSDWMHRFAQKKMTEFSELKVVEKQRQDFEIKLSTTIQGCKVEIVGHDYSLLQRLLRKMST